MKASVTLDDGTTWSGVLSRDIEPPPDLPGSIGYLGVFSVPHCIVRGAHQVAAELGTTTPLWEPYYGTALDEPYYDGTPPTYADGGWIQGLYRYTFGLGAWANPEPELGAWGDLDEQLALHPDTTAIWWVVCYTDDDWRNSQDPEPKMEAVLEILRQRWAGPVFASLMPYYGDIGPRCKSVRDEYNDAVQVVLDRWIADGIVLRGPVVPTPQTVDKVQPGAGELGEGHPPWPQPGRCSINDAGTRVLGAPLAAFDWSLPAGT